MPEGYGKQNRRSRREDNRGVSFVEVIVSMLVLAIALISLLGAFTMSFRINLKSRRAMSASIVAQNVMECVKEYADFHAVVSGVSEEMQSFLPANYATSFAQTADGFTLSSVVEGSSEYQVVVTYDKQDFTEEDGSGINDYRIPDLTTLNSENTIIVCPTGISTGQMEDAAISYFVEVWVAQQWALYGDSDDDEDSEAGEEDEEEPEYTGPTVGQIEEQRTLIRQGMKGALTLSLAQVAGGHMLTADLIYEWDTQLWPAYHIESGTVANLESIYVFYDPVQLKAKAGNEYEILDTITLQNFNKKLDVFLAVQENFECLGVVADTLTGPKLTNSASTGPVTVYASTTLGMDMHALTGFEDAKTLISRKKYERMQNVTVQVYLKSSGDLMATMETAISQ